MNILRVLAGLLLLSVISEDCAAQEVTSDPATYPVLLPAGTSVILHLKESLYRKDAKPGQPIAFEVGYDVAVNGQICIAWGTPVIGTFRGLERTDKGHVRVLIDIGTAQTVASDAVRLTSANPAKSGDEFDPMMVAEFPPLVPIVLIARLFEKKKLLDENAGAGWGSPGGVWIVVRTAEEITLDPEKQKAAQASYAERLETLKLQFQRFFESSEGGDGYLAWWALWRKPSLLREAGDLDGAIRAHREFLEISDLGVLKQSRCLIHDAIAELLVEKEDYGQAIAEYRGVDESGPCGETSRLSLIKALERSGDSDAAITEAREGIQKWPQNTEMRYRLGRLLVEKKNAQGAIEVLQGALSKRTSMIGPCQEAKSPPDAFGRSAV